jgi:type I restriction enzyme, R subunit
MTTQSEQVLENKLIAQLVRKSYELVTIKDASDLKANLKLQIERRNNTTLTDKEFQKVLNHLDKGTVFERAHILRDRMQLTREDDTSVYLLFLDQSNWGNNTYQVTNQVKMEGSYKNRYDVTILINGLPLVQIELKRRGLELKEAFNQTNRYQRHSYWASGGLFNYIQCFVISNGVNTKYYANNKHQSFKQTFFWANEDNSLITNLSDFTDEFLPQSHLHKMLCKYIVLNQSEKILMILRPYQYYATEAIVRRIKTTRKNGYIWHTTGSGKTLTSFKASQILMDLPDIHKVVFVVDRKDLDYQTIKEFDSFSKGSVDATDRTKTLVDQFLDKYKEPKTGALKEHRLIVTTIQKLNTAISKPHFLKSMKKLRDKRIVFIFDECHRSQFGETHRRITQFFTNHQLFGFTGTPILEENAYSVQSIKHTTKELFHDCLHKYVITDAIRDKNVLRFAVEYIGRYKKKEGRDISLDIDVEAINTKEVLEAPGRLEKITEYIIANHGRKTHSRSFTAIFCVSSIDILTQYYDLFKAKKDEGKHNLKIATIFSYTANEDDKDATGIIEELPMAADPTSPYGNMHSRDKLESYIGDYNKMFGTSYSTRDSALFYNYYKDISKRVKNRQIDILLVVNMFLTGFDSKLLNTLYVDKNLRYHGLIQAFSRTNRILDEVKSQGNIVCFRNLKARTDEAITLFSNKDAKEEILLAPYEDYVGKFNAAYLNLLQIAPTVKSVDTLPSEKEQAAFIQAFRELMRLKNILESFSSFTEEDLSMDSQSFADYKSKYLDLYREVRESTTKEKVSILDDIDFELELITRDNINVAYILALLAKFKDSSEEERQKQRKAIIQLISGEVHLVSKRELIEKFIDENIPHIEDSDDIPEAFEVYWNAQKMKAIDSLCQEENLDPVKLETVIGNYLYTERKPLNDDIVGMLKEKPKLLQRKSITERVLDKMLSFVETYIDGMAA